MRTMSKTTMSIIVVATVAIIDWMHNRAADTPDEWRSRVCDWVWRGNWVEHLLRACQQSVSRWIQHNR